MNESTVSHLMDGLLFLTLVRGKTDVGILTELTILTMTKGLIMLAEMRVDAYAVAQEFSRQRHVKTLSKLLSVPLSTILFQWSCSSPSTPVSVT